MKKSLLASAIAMAFCGAAFAQQTANPTGDGSAKNVNYSDSSTYSRTDSSTRTRTDSSTHTRTDSSTNKDSGDAVASASRTAALNNGSTGAFDNAFNFNKTTATASSELNGTVSNNGVWGIGNQAINNGSAAGGKAYGGTGGKA